MEELAMTSPLPPRRLARLALALVVALAGLACATESLHAQRGANAGDGARFGIRGRPDVTIHPPVHTEEGVEFSVTAPGADSVSVVGTWNDWDRHADRMGAAEAGGPWRCVVPLEPGAYQFKCRYHVSAAGEWRPYPEPQPDVEQIYDDGNALTLIVEEGGGTCVYASLSGERWETTQLALSADYNRVDGVALSLGIEYDPRRAWVPRFVAIGGHSFALDRGNYFGRAELPVLGVHALAVGGELFQRTAHFDDRRITDGENLFAALVLSEDFRDYIRERGWRALVVSRLRPFHEIEASYSRHTYRSVPSQTDWSLFGSDKEFRPNDLFSLEDEGALRTIGVTYRWDTRRERGPGSVLRDDPPGEIAKRPGWAAAARMERSVGDGDDDAFDYELWDVELRHRAKLARRLQLAARAARGGTAGEPPAQKRFYLGGIGTLRGHAFKTLAGEHYALANVEARFAATSALALSLFTDAGDAWGSRSEQAKLHVDVGVGVGSRDGNLQVDFARPLESGSDGATRVTVRAARSF
jgi:hypothetical protein